MLLLLNQEKPPSGQVHSSGHTQDSVYNADHWTMKS